MGVIMARKKRTIRKENYGKKLRDEQVAQEKKSEERQKQRETLRNERREELLEKMGSIEPSASGDVKMDGSGKRVGIKRTIQKHKANTKATKALLKKAKQQGIIRNVKDARRILEGKKKNTTKPDGRERARDKKIRVYREKRERKMGIVHSEEEEDDEESDDEV